jgi:hypothetical protein
MPKFTNVYVRECEWDIQERDSANETREHERVITYTRYISMRMGIVVYMSKIDKAGILVGWQEVGW